MGIECTAFARRRAAGPITKGRLMMTRFSNARRWGALVCSCLLLLITACGDTDGTNNGSSGNNGTQNQTLEVEGTWVTNFGSTVEIDDESWGDHAVVEFDNDEAFAITEVPDSAETNPGTFNKLVWTEPSDGTWWYCTVDFGLESVEAALNTEKTADASNPAESGCGDFAWTQMRVPIELTGTYTTQFEGTEVITATTWDFGIETAIVDWDNEDNWAVTQNPDDAEMNASTFNKVVWTEPDTDGVFYYCTVDFGLETEESARNSEESADSSMPEEGGCGDFPWTKMTPEES